MLEIKIDASQLNAQLDQLMQRLQRPSALMAAVAQSLESQTQQAFDQQGQPGGDKWQSLSESTIAQRTLGRKGKNPEPPSWPGQILNRSGGRGLLGSVMSGSTASTASVGAGSGKSAKYAKIHQFGGQAGRGRKVTIPARPYLPITPSTGGQALTPHAEKAIIKMALKFIENGAP